MTRFGADYNSLEKLTSGFLFSCKRLNQLYLHNNKIKEIVSDAFIGLIWLQFLDLSSNQITYLDKNVFKPLKKLNNLNLKVNQIRIIDANLFRYNMIGSLDLSNNNLKSIPSEIFQMLEYLEVFSANNNPNISSIGTKYLDSLKELNIDNLSLTTLFIPSNVEIVSASNNQLSQIVVEPDNRLTYLNLSGNCLTSPLLNGTFNKLRDLFLVENPIQINDLSVVKLKTKYPSTDSIYISNIDDEKAKQMILEAEENQIDLGISIHTVDMLSATRLYFNRFDSIWSDQFNANEPKFHTTSPVKKYITNMNNEYHTKYGVPRREIPCTPDKTDPKILNCDIY